MRMSNRPASTSDSRLFLDGHRDRCRFPASLGSVLNHVLDCTLRVATIPSSPWDLALQLLLGHTKQGSTVRYLYVEMDETEVHFVYRADRIVTGGREAAMAGSQLAFREPDVRS